MDIYMDNHLISKDEITLTILCALSIGIKMNEKNCIVEMNELNSFTSDYYNLCHFRERESDILFFFGWDVLIPTIPTFLEYYNFYALLPQEFNNNRKLFSKFKNGFEDLKILLLENIKYLSSFLLKDVGYHQFSPSILAASCIAFSRKALSIRPIWSNHLKKVTLYTFQDLINCIYFIKT